MKLKTLWFGLLFVIGCATGDASTNTNTLPTGPDAAVDSGSDADVTDALAFNDAAQRKDSGTHSRDAGDSGGDANACEILGTIVGHCLTHQGTLCVGYPSNHEAECLKSGLVTGWYPGPCGTNDNDNSNLNRSSGGCEDKCGIISWSYPLGGGPPTDKTKADLQQMCEDAGLVYVPVP